MHNKLKRLVATVKQEDILPIILILLTYFNIAISSKPSSNSKNIYELEYCVVNNPINNISFTKKNNADGTNSFLISSTKDEPTYIYSKNSITRFPSKVQNNHILVKLFKNSKSFKVDDWGNLRMCTIGKECEEPTLATDKENIRESDIAEFDSKLLSILENDQGFYSFPFNYYFKDEYIRNKINLEIEGYGMLNEGKIRINKISTEQPLPTGITIQIKNQKPLPPYALKGGYIDFTPNDILKSMIIKNTTTVNFWTVKEYDIALSDIELYTSNSSLALKVSRDFCKKLDNSSVNRTNKLKTILPINFKFSGEVLTDSSCFLTSNDIDYFFYDRIETLKVSEKEPSHVVLPQESIKEVELIFKNQKSVLNITRRYKIKKGSKTQAQPINPKANQQDLTCITRASTSL